MRSTYAVLIVLVAVALFVLVNYGKRQAADSDDTSTTAQPPHLTCSTQQLAVNSLTDTHAPTDTRLPLVPSAPEED